MSELRPQGHVPANRFELYVPMTPFNSELAVSLESVRHTTYSYPMW